MQPKSHRIDDGKISRSVSEIRGRFRFRRASDDYRTASDKKLQNRHFDKWHIGPDDSDGTYGIDRVQTIGKASDKSAGRDDDVYSAAIDFIRENKGGLFYMNVWVHATHFPVNTAAGLAANLNNVKVNRKDFPPTMMLAIWCRVISVAPMPVAVPKFWNVYA